MRSIAARALTLAALAIVATACGNGAKGPGAGVLVEHAADEAGTAGESGAGGGGSCVLLVRFRGHDYEGMGVRIAPRHGGGLGKGVFPACNDTNGGGGHAQRIAIEALPGVPPRIAVLVHGWNDSVFVRDDVEELSPDVQRLTEPVTCRASDAPITLLGEWTGIIQPNGTTELDLVPPYHLDVSVRQASQERYERAFLTLIVPSSLGTPLDRNDVLSSLGEGGDLSARVHCGSNDAFVAERVEAFPPS